MLRDAVVEHDLVRGRGRRRVGIRVTVSDRVRVRARVRVRVGVRVRVRGRVGVRVRVRGWVGGRVRVVELDRVKRPASLLVYFTTSILTLYEYIE